MARYIAFLRAINVGGHTVKMDRLRQLFEALEFSNVETFIASGNVVFETTSGDTAALEDKIEQKLCEVLGYPVDTFVRTLAELAKIANYKPFPQAEVEDALGFYVAFLAQAPDARGKRKITAMRTETDDLRIHGRELYWLRRQPSNAAPFSYPDLDRALGGPSTFRGVNTIRKMAAKYC